jgi:hypothetical protein
MTDVSSPTPELTREQLDGSAPASAPAPAQLPAGLPPGYDSADAVAARAEIQTKIGDREFYKLLVSERERGVTGPASKAWDDLHKRGWPLPNAVASQADVDIQADAQTARAWNGYVSWLKEQFPDLTEQQERDVRAGITNQISHDWAVRQKDLLIKSKDFRLKLLNGGLKEREVWARINGMLAMKVVG